VVNPPTSALERATLDLIVAASEENILMVEGEASEVQEHEVLEALKVAHDAIKVHCQVQKELAAEVGKTEKRTYSTKRTTLN
jgi:polyribonucleotide nucleotidyltransferase